jgi:hypothetical protein
MAKHRLSLWQRIYVYLYMKVYDLKIYLRESPLKNIVTDLLAWFVMLLLLTSPITNLVTFWYFGHKLYPEIIHF